MSAEERREYQTTMGQTAKLWMEQFFDSEDYAGMTTEERAAQVEAIVKSAEKVAKDTVAETMGIGNPKALDADISKEVERLELAGESGFAPSYPSSKQFTDPKNKEKQYTFSAEELAQWQQIYREEYEKLFNEVMNTSKYKNADDKKKAEMLADARSEARDDAKDAFIEALKKAGIRAEKKPKK